MGVRELSPRPLAAAVTAAACLIAAGCFGDDDDASVTPLPRAVCAPLVQGNAAPDVIVVSDLPLRGALSPSTKAMAGAVRATVAAHGFRAGRHSIGFQSCDDSSAEEGNFTPGRCAASMRAYGENRAVVGVVGPFNSDCARAQIAIANEAPDGPLAMISHANTRTGLTRPAAGAAADEPERYYPRKLRNYARLPAPEADQVAEDVRLAKRLGARSMFVLDDDEEYGIQLARDFRALAPGLGVRVAGSAVWGEGEATWKRAARKAAASKADGVYVSGIWQAKGVEMVGELRRALGNRALLIAPDGFASLPKDTFASMGGLWVTVPGLPPERYPPSARAVERRFGPGQINSLGPAYAAQATEVMLDAIGRSDGSRADVTRKLLATDMRSSVLGPVRFDEGGDLVGAPISIYRVARRELRLHDVEVPP